MLHTLPVDIISTLARFLKVDALSRLKQTCRVICNEGILPEAWHNALFDDSDWYVLKDVKLAAKYMAWQGRVRSPQHLSSLETMQDIAVWGTLADGERVVATFGPMVMDVRVYGLHNDDDDKGVVWNTIPDCVPFVWENRTIKDQFVNRGRSIRVSGTSIHVGVEQPFFSKKCSINVFATVNGVGVCELMCKEVKPQRPYDWGSSVYFVDPVELAWDDDGVRIVVQPWGIAFSIYETPLPSSHDQ